MNLQKFELRKVIQAGEVLTKNGTHIRIRTLDGFIDAHQGSVTNFIECGDPVGQYAVKVEGGWTVVDALTFAKLHSSIDPASIVRNITKCIETAFACTATKFEMQEQDFLDTYHDSIHLTATAEVYLDGKALDVTHHIKDGKFTTCFSLDGEVHDVIFTPHRNPKVAEWADRLLHVDISPKYTSA